MVRTEENKKSIPSPTAVIATIVCTAMWLGAFAHWRYGPILPEPFSQILHWVAFGAQVPVTIVWLWWSCGGGDFRRATNRSSNRVGIAAIASISLLFWWQFAVFASGELGLAELRVTFATVGLWFVFFVGLAWIVWGLEWCSYRYRNERVVRGEGDSKRRIWNPLDVDAWYFGRKNRGLNQSLSALLGYSLLFWLISLLLTQTRGCSEIYEMPAGGGQQ
ncbi:MAG: hypothetical protein FJ267_01270, partial [Planctomycetes bacterium]|nr:hypothetical protein [Planctomycetota bacterium]